MRKFKHAKTMPTLPKCSKLLILLNIVKLAWILLTTQIVHKNIQSWYIFSYMVEMIQLIQMIHLFGV